MKQSMLVFTLQLVCVSSFVVSLSHVDRTVCIGQETPIQISFEPPAQSVGPRQPLVRPVSDRANRSKVRFAFGPHVTGADSERLESKVRPQSSRASQIAAERRQSQKESIRKQLQPSPIPRRLEQGPTQVQSPTRSRAPEHGTPEAIVAALTSGGYDGYIVVSDEEYAQIRKGIISRIDPGRVRTLTSSTNIANPSSTEYDNMYRRLEFSLAKLPQKPNATTLPPPSASSVWTRFLTGKESNEIRTWKHNYIELAQRPWPSIEREKGEITGNPTLLARGESASPMERKPSAAPESSHTGIRLVTGTIPQDEMPKHHEAKPLRMETVQDDSGEEVKRPESGPMRVYRPRD